MFTLIEVKNDFCLDFFFVSLFVKDNILFLNPIAGIAKTFSAEIPLNKIIALSTTNEALAGRCTFMYERVTYSIIDYGNGVSKYFTEILK